VSVESKIDELYRLPLQEFTSARNALAKGLSGDDAKRVKALAKPTVVPWAVNQLFWKARHVYERLMKSGEALRKAQLAALGGGRTRPADLQRASDNHRKALSDAVQQARKLAESDGSKPDADALSRTLESLSLAPERPERPGRLTEIVRPAGFEALLNASIAGARTPTERDEEQPAKGDDKVSDDRKSERERERQHAAQRRRAEAAVDVAEGEVERAITAEARAREAFEDADRDLERAKAVEKKARDAHERAQQALTAAKEELAAARQALADVRTNS
jgi:hypothetical protein